MCFYTTLKKDAETLQKRFNALVTEKEKINDIRNTVINGFSQPDIPIITNVHTATISFAKWGLIPNWADGKFNANTLNAKIETLKEKPSFSPYIDNRCLILADGFYEWKWLDARGKQKEKYYITLPDQQVFAFAGIYNIMQQFQEPPKITVSIITTAANEFMANIHNTKKRMPVILSENEETSWLQGNNIEAFSNCNPQLLAVKENPIGQQFLF